MPIQPMTFPILGFEQTNPVAAYQQRAADTRLRNVQAMTESQSLADKLRLMRAHAQAAEIANEYLPEKSQAEIAEMLGRGNLYNIQSQAAEAMLPAQIAKAQLEAQYPGMTIPGVSQQVEFARYLSKVDPNFFNSSVGNGNFDQAAQDIQAGNFAIPQNQFGRLADAVRASGGQALMSQENTSRGTLQDQLLNYIAPETQQIKVSMAPESQNVNLPQQLLGQQYGMQQPSTMRDMLLNNIFLNQQEKQAKTNLYNARAMGIPWNSMSSSYKSSELAQAKAFGYNYSDASKLLSKGISLDDMAKAKGFDPNDKESWPLADFAPTQAVLTRQEQSNIALAGMNAIEPKITEAIAPYAKRWDGVSLEQLADASKGSNIDRQAKALAAGAAQIELSLLRARAGGVTNIGIEMLKETLNASGNRLNIPTITQNPELYRRAQRELSQYINDLNKAENNKLKSLFKTYGSTNNELENVGNLDIDNAVSALEGSES